MNSLLKRCGEALYGPRWQSELARGLDVSDRTVRRWAAGDAVPDGVYLDLHRLCSERATTITKVQLAIDLMLAGAMPPRDIHQTEHK
jgi:hypothetical protein